jgi:mannose-6-phosphate isomerase-like protein (cupin superfamily)
MAGAGKEYPPLILERTGTGEFRQWMKEITIPTPAEPFDNLSFYDLPSTDAVTNFMVWVKNGHDEEEHNNFREFVVILEGHCDMYMNGEKKHFTAGEIICIPPFVPHHAVITSGEPMVAIVQRQLIAA